MSGESSWWKKTSTDKDQSIDKDFDTAKTRPKEPDKSAERHEPAPDRYPAPGGDWATMRTSVMRYTHEQAHSRLIEKTKDEIRQVERKPVELSKDKDHER